MSCTKSLLMTASKWKKTAGKKSASCQKQEITFERLLQVGSPRFQHPLAGPNPMTAPESKKTLRQIYTVNATSISNSINFLPHMILNGGFIPSILADLPACPRRRLVHCRKASSRPSSENLVQSFRQIAHYPRSERPNFWADCPDSQASGP